MNYDAFMEPLTWFLTGMEKHSDEYRQDHAWQSGFFLWLHALFYDKIPYAVASGSDE